MLRAFPRLVALSIPVLVGLQGLSAHGQASPNAAPDMTLDAPTRADVIDGVLDELMNLYVFPEVAVEMAERVRHRRRSGEYDAITSARALATTLTLHLREVSRDKHLTLDFSPDVVPPSPTEPRLGPSQDELERQRRAMSRLNFGFERVERLAGNIGYLDLRAFVPPALMGDTAAAAMGFLGNTEALIIDLRENDGGSPEAVILLASYLFDHPVRMNDIYARPSDETRQFWTLPYVPGPRFVGKDVYVLTSSRTFSAAEDFTYGLKNQKRVTIIGETTRGGAHPVGPRRISDHFVLRVPMARSISPITHTDWEGTGVVPDIQVPAARALTTAHLMALETQKTRVADGPVKAELDAAIDRLESELEPSEEQPAR